MSEHPQKPEKKEVKGRLEDAPDFEPLPEEERLHGEWEITLIGHPDRNPLTAPGGDFGVKAGWIGVDLYSGRLREALRFAEEAHRGQVRKGTEGVPYVLHPIAVAMILAGEGADEDLVIAGLLHDVAEDTPVDLSMIERRFGPRVGATVAQLTKASEKALTAHDVAEMLRSEEAVAVKSADLIVNLGDLLFDATEHGSAHLEKLFREPVLKLRSYLDLAELLVDRLSSRPKFRDSLMQLSSAARPLLEDLGT